MPNQTGPEWVRLGEMLVRRRIEMDSRYRNRQQFCRDRGADYRIVAAIENAERDNFEAATLSAAEVWYSLAPGSISRALKGAELEPAPANASAAAPRDFIPALQADPEDIGPYERSVWAEVATALAQYGPDATGEQVFPGSRAEAKAWEIPEFRSREERVRFVARLRQVTAPERSSQAVLERA